MAGSLTPPADLDASGLRIAIVAARFNADITQRLVDGALRGLKEHAAPEPDVVWVPGAFELPFACRVLAVEPGASDPAAARLVGERRVYDALIALGCVIRGETPHFDYVAGEAARGIMQVSLDTGVPVAFGVLTTEDHDQALARAGGAHGDKGYDAALTAIEMALVSRRMR